MNLRFPKRVLAMACVCTMVRTGTALCQPLDSGYREPALPAPLLEISWPALATRLGGASQLTMQCKGASLAQVATQISRQSSLKFSVAPEVANAKTITANFDKAPYWMVIRQIERQAGVVSKLDPYRLGLRWETDPSQNWQFLGAHGPFDLMLNSNASGRLTFRLLIDPKIRLMNDIITYRISEAIDENNTSVLPSENEGSIAPENYRVNQSLRTFQLALIATGGKKLKTLRGEFRAVVATREELWEIPAPVGILPIEKLIERGGIQDRITAKGVQGQGPNWLADFTVVRRVGGTIPYYLSAQGQKFYAIPERLGVIRLLDKTGRDISYPQFASGKIYAEDVVTSGLRCTFQPPAGDPSPAGAPAKLSIEMPVQWRELVVPFELRDLKLPS